jgi:hypothetical protein
VAQAPVQFREAEDAENGLMEAVLGKWHPELDGYAISLIFRDKPRKRGGNQCLATAHKASPEVAFLTGLDGWIEVWEEAWGDTADPDFQNYLLDHELTHFVISEGDLQVIDHDIQEFEDVLARHGSGVAGLREVLERLPQGSPI